MADLPRQVGGSPHCDRLHLAPQELLHSDLEGNSVLAQATPGSHGFLFDAEAWLAGSPLRPAAGWALLVAAFSAAWGRVEPDVFWRSAILGLLLVDLLWGGIWHALVQPPAATGGHRVRRRIWLPYLRPGSAAARLLGWEGTGSLAVVGQRVLASLFLALIVSWSLGLPVVAMTGLSCLVAVLAGLHRREPLMPLGLLHAVAAIGLPWLTGLLIFDGWPGQSHLWLPALWMLHSWGAFRVLARSSDSWGLAMLGTAQAGLLLLFVIGRAPIWTAVLATVFLPTWLAVVNRRTLGHVRVWWLAALLISGIVLNL